MLTTDETDKRTADVDNEQMESQKGKETMNLIERYVSAIGKQLPRKSRADIETEIRSTLEDMLEERAARAGRPADDEMVKELLKEYGAPAKVAASYLPTQYLIGPKLFPIFLLVLKIVGTVLLALVVIGMGIKIGLDGLNGQQAAQLIGRYALEFISGIITAFGNIVLVFAILERVLPQSEYEKELDADWSPEELSKDADPDEVHAWEAILTIVFTALGLVLLNFYPQVLGFYFFSGDVSVFLPALSDAFFRMLPWINVTWLLGIGLNAWLLRQGRWTLPARWFEIALQVAGVAIAYLLLQGPSVLALDVARLVQAGFEPGAAGVLVNLIQQVVTISLAIAVMVGGIEVVRGFYNLLIKNKRRPLPVR
ncbi:MAG: hypothetical protein Fur0016_06250 [Anaerolineales bacterium]